MTIPLVVGLAIMFWGKTTPDLQREPLAVIILTIPCVTIMYLALAAMDQRRKREMREQHRAGIELPERQLETSKTLNYEPPRTATHQHATRLNRYGEPRERFPGWARLAIGVFAGFLVTLAFNDRKIGIWMFFGVYLVASLMLFVPWVRWFGVGMFVGAALAGLTVSVCGGRVA